MKHTVDVIVVLLAIASVVGCDSNRTMRSQPEPVPHEDIKGGDAAHDPDSGEGLWEPRRPRDSDDDVGNEALNEADGHDNLHTIGEKGRTEQKGIMGVWVVVASKFSGEARPAAAGETWTFGEDKVTTVSKAGSKEAYRYLLDATKEPAEMALLSEDEAFVVTAIYSLQNDELTVCFSFKEYEVPGEFVTEPGDDRFLLTLKRVQSAQE